MNQPALKLEFEAKVRDVSAEGMGVVDHPDGKVFFVPGVWPGDSGTFRIISEEKRYGTAELIHLQIPSSDRRDPSCSHQGFSSSDCGGCPWMGISYEAQLKQKQQLVETAVQRAGLKLKSEDSLKNIIGSPKKLNYRNRAQFKTDGKQLGYFAQGTQQLVDIDNCPILTEKMNQNLDALRKKLPNEKWGPEGYHPWNFFDVDEDSNTELATPGRKRPFRQANTEQNAIMKDWLSKQIARSEKPESLKVLELFCGDGNFTEVFDKSKVKEVLAIEASDDSLQRLEKKKLKSVTMLQSDLYHKKSRKELIRYISKANLLFLDPPRSGYPWLHELLQKQKKVSRVIYVSCSLSTFIRDVSKLQGWEVDEIQPVDQFPHTPHIELLASLVKTTQK